MANKDFKILLINPVIRNDDKPKHVPYGMAQLAAVIRREGYKVQVFDANAWRPSEAQVRAVLKADDWDIIGTGGLITSYGFIKQVLKLAEELCPEAYIIAGGGFIAPIPFEVMGFIPQIDAAVIGEGVVTFPELLRVLVSGERDLSSVAGIIWRHPQKGIFINEARPLLQDVDSIPFPAYDLFPMEIYFKNSSILLSEEAMMAKRRMDVLASYGCPFRCKYCFHLGMSGEIKIEGQSVKASLRYGHSSIRMHSPEYIVDLAKYLKDNYKIDFIAFIDENFIFLDRYTKGVWMDRFEQLWVKAGLAPVATDGHKTPEDNGIHWGAMAHVNLVTPENLKRIHDLGCTYLDYGFESFDDEILRSIGKGATAEQNEKALKWTVAAGIRPVPNQIIGFPKEEFRSIKTTVKAWKRLGIRSYPFFATPYPGSEWFEEYREKIVAQYDGDLEAFLLDLGDATKITAVISENFSAVELLGLRELMAQGDIRRIEDHERLCRSRCAA